MKTAVLFLASASLLSAAPAQTTPPTEASQAAQRAATYQGPKVMKDSKALGRKMVQKSKPADGIRMRLPVKK